MPDFTEIQEICSRIQRSRMRLLVEHGFYGMLLMHVKMKLDDQIETAATDGESIFFDTAFLSTLTDKELDFVMLHEILHIALNHLSRSSEFEDHETANIAADIVVNSHICLECGNSTEAISIHGKPMLHTLPDGSPGWNYSMEEVYHILKQVTTKPRKLKGSSIPGEKGVPSETDNDEEASPNEEGNNGRNSKDEHFGKHDAAKGDAGKQAGFDNHSKWSEAQKDSQFQEKWCKYISDAIQAIMIQQDTIGSGGIPLLGRRILQNLREPQLDWRQILNEFIRQEITDYSFMPPDKRFSDSDFFLPDFNLPEDKTENILFMIDTSGSMSDQAVGEVYSEVKGAVDQFDRKLTGWLGFFEAVVVPPVRFDDVGEFVKIAAYGGGGTSFQAVFDYVRDQMQDEPPVCIIILTDGQDDFPNESAAMGIPVLWVINNQNITPPWGKIAYLSR